MKTEAVEKLIEAFIWVSGDNNVSARLLVSAARTELTAIVKALGVTHEALSFYANWARNNTTPSKGFAAQYDLEKSPLARDRGARAISALAHVKAVIGDVRK